MSDILDNRSPSSVDSGQRDSSIRGRRAVIKGVVGAMPMILTLQSGAALARSSNLITASRAASAIDSQGRTLCLNYRYADATYNNNTVADLGNGDPVVTAIPERDYHAEANYGSDEVSEEKLCLRGGAVNWKPKSGPWVETDYVPRGMLVSATALSSFANIDITEI